MSLSLTIIGCGVIITIIGLLVVVLVIICGLKEKGRDEE